MSSHDPDRASLMDYLKSWPLYLLPHHAISRLVLKATRCTRPAWKNRLIRWFVGHFNVDMSDAVEPEPTAYAHFNAFFTRALKRDARPLASGVRTLLCPVDGAVSQCGDIRDGRIFQAKGQNYSLQELLGGDAELAAPLQGGRFTTLYLSPRDYHRIHMPCDGRLQRSVYVPGRLFSVAPHTVRTVPRLFARNERLVCLFDTPAGPMALVLVGAINVACIETVWAGVVTPPHRRRVRVTDHRNDGISLRSGEEMGRFNMGSTVIVLFGPDSMDWDHALCPGAAVKMGQPLGKITHHHPEATTPATL